MACGWAQSSDVTKIPEAWAAAPKAVLGHEVHGLSAAYRASIDSAPASMPAAHWLGRLSKAPGVRKDARGWYGVEKWLAAQGERKVEGAEVLAQLEAREFSLQVGWSSANKQSLIVTMATNPATQDDFCSTHEVETPNVVLNICVANKDSSGKRGLLEVYELQSDWHQQGAKTGYDARIVDKLRARKNALNAAKTHALNLVKQLISSPEGMSSALAMMKLPPAGGAVAAWQVLNDLTKRLREQKSPGLDAEWVPADVWAAVQSYSDHEAISLNWKDEGVVPPAPFETDWPRLGLVVAMAYAAVARDRSGNLLYNGVALPDGHSVAHEAEDTICHAQWKVTPAQDVAISMEGTNSVCVDVTIASDDLAGDTRLPAVFPEIARRIADGQTTGALPQEWFKALGKNDPGVVWQNLGLRRFYDNHLPREMREVARSTDAYVDGRSVMLTPQSRKILTELFASMQALWGALPKSQKRVQKTPAPAM